MPSRHTYEARIELRPEYQKEHGRYITARAKARNPTAAKNALNNHYRGRGEVMYVTEID